MKYRTIISKLRIYKYLFKLRLLESQPQGLYSNLIWLIYSRPRDIFPDLRTKDLKVR